MYVDDSADDIIGCLGHAARLSEQCQDLVARVRDAVAADDLRAYGPDLPGRALAAEIISEVEAEQLRALEKAVRRAIDVDDFDSEALWARAVAEQPAADAA